MRLFHKKKLILAINGVFPISILTRKRPAHACSNNIPIYVMQNNINNTIYQNCFRGTM